MSVIRRSTSKGQSTPQKRLNVLVSKELTQKVIDTVAGLPSGTPKTDYLKEHLLTKFVSEETDPPHVRKQRAINKWFATEEQNSSTNDRLLNVDPAYQILPGLEYEKFINWVSEFISSIIGDTVPEDALLGSFSGGASTSRVRARSFPASKYIGQADITSAAMPWFETLLGLIPGWEKLTGGVRTSVVPGNVLFTVPKNATIDRVAAKEPELNMFLQKGAGDHIRRSLRRFGIDLNDQSINRDAARKGSIISPGSQTGPLATIDLSSASDSVSYMLVQSCLPPHWFCYLNEIRSPVTRMPDGSEHRNHMFSSMGNGFTFELESLLFFALAKACAYFTGTRGFVSVYGDDIIVPVELAESLTDVLAFMGFQVNTDKSFTDGPIRESCGGHYYNGCDITPFYLREPIRFLTDVIHVANAIRKWSVIEGSVVLDESLYELWLELKAVVPRKFWGGTDYNSIGQLVSYDTPHLRLIPASSRKGTGLGGLVHWFNVTCFRPSRIRFLTVPYKDEVFVVQRETPLAETVEAIVTSARSVVSSEYVARRSTTVGRTDTVFYEEVVDVPITQSS